MQDVTTFISHHPLLSVATALVLLLLLVVELLRAKRNGSALNPSQVTQMINHQNAVILDLRSTEVYQQSHIIDALSLPAKDIHINKKLEKFKNRPIIIVSNTHNEAQKTAALLVKQSYNAYSLAGGMRAWIEAQMPVIKENK